MLDTTVSIHVTTAELQKMTRETTFQQCIVFLTFSFTGHLADVLQEANVPIISDAVCNAPDYYDNQITTSMFCAGYEKGGTDACQVRVCLSVFMHPAS